MRFKKYILLVQYFMTNFNKCVDHLKPICGSSVCLWTLSSAIPPNLNTDLSKPLYLIWENHPVGME